MAEASRQRPRPCRLATALLLLATLLVGLEILRRQPRTGWSLAEAPADAAPPRAAISRDVRRVVLISIDTLRADHLGCYGYSRDTSPNIDALAAAGVLFNHAVAPVPTTLPSHATMLTGTTPLHHGIHGNVGYRLDESRTTLAELLRSNGFATAAFVGAYVLDSQFGLGQGFGTYDDDIEAVHGNVYHDERPAERTTALANAWLAAHRHESFFLFLHYYDPHSPHELRAGHAFQSLPLLAFPVDAYDSEIAYTDRHVGMVLEQLKRLGLYDSTLVIVTGDHGEGHDDHSEDRHGFFVYHSTIHVPLIVKAPGQTVPRRVEDAVGLVDIVPTICSLTGIASPEHVEGMDLSAFLEGAPPPEENRALFSETLQPTAFGAAPLLALTTNRWKYIHSVRPELYDLLEDPRETKNLIDTGPSDAEPLRNLLLDMLARHDAAGAAAAGSLDRETLDRLRSLGYVGLVADESLHIQAGQRDAKDMIGAWSARNEITSLVARGELEAARTLSLRLLERHPQLEEPFVFELLASLALEEGDHASATRYLDRLLALDYAPYNVHISYGAALTELGDYAQAIEHFEAALAIDSESPHAYMALANTYAAAGQFGKAAATTRQALERARARQDARLTADIERQLRAHRAGRRYRRGP